MQDLFDQPLAIDPTANGGAGAVIAGAEFEVFAEDDLSFANPLPVYEAVSGALIDTLTSSSIGQLPQFRAEGDPESVILKSGAYAVRVNSLVGIAKQAVEAVGLDAATVAAAIAAGEAVPAAAALAEAARAAAEVAGSTATDAVATAVAARVAAEAAAASVQRDQPDGVAPLDGTSKLPEANVPTRLSDAALSAKIADQIDAASPVARLVKKLADAQDVVIATATDSTGDRTTSEPDRATWRMLTELVQLGYAGVFKHWDAPATEAYRADVAVHPVAPAAPAPYTHRAFYDNFYRGTGDLNGRTPNEGLPWVSGGNGLWSTTAPGPANRIGTSAGYIYAETNVPSGKMTFQIRGLLVDRVTTAAGNRSVQIGLLAGSSGNDLVHIEFVVLADLSVTWKLYKNDAGVTGNVMVGSGNPLPAAVGDRFDVTITLDGTTVTGTVNGVSITGTITAGLADRIRATPKARLYVNANSTAMSFEAAEWLINVTPAAPSAPAERSQIVMYNGSESNTRLEYQLARLDVLYPVEPDVLIVDSVHNYSGYTLTNFLAAIDAFRGAFKAKYPSTPIVWSQQNPRGPGSTIVAEHAARNAALKDYATAHGDGLIPAYDEWVKLPNRGSDLVKADGTHPTDAWAAPFPYNGYGFWGMLGGWYLRGGTTAEWEQISAAWLAGRAAWLAQYA